MMEFDGYLSRMMLILNIPMDESLSQESSLYDDAKLDSLQAFELLVLTEQLAGLDVPPPEVPLIFTLGDAYNYYLDCAEAAREQD